MTKTNPPPENGEELEKQFHLPFEPSPLPTVSLQMCPEIAAEKKMAGTAPGSRRGALGSPIWAGLGEGRKDGQKRWECEYVMALHGRCSLPTCPTSIQSDQGSSVPPCLRPFWIPSSAQTSTQTLECRCGITSPDENTGQRNALPPNRYEYCPRIHSLGRPLISRTVPRAFDGFPPPKSPSHAFLKLAGPISQASSSRQVIPSSPRGLMQSMRISPNRAGPATKRFATRETKVRES